VVQLQAALLLKRKVANLYKSFDQAAKLGLMTTLLNLYASEGTAPKVLPARTAQSTLHSPLFILPLERTPSNTNTTPLLRPQVSSALAGSLSAIAPKVFKENGGSWPDLTQAIGVLSQGTPAQQVPTRLTLTVLLSTNKIPYEIPNSIPNQRPSLNQSINQQSNQSGAGV